MMGFLAICDIYMYASCDGFGGGARFDCSARACFNTRSLPMPSFTSLPCPLFFRFNSKRERAKFKRALQRAEWVGRQEAKNAWAKALEEEEAKKIPYEVRRWGVGGGGEMPSFALKKKRKHLELSYFHICTKFETSTCCWHFLLATTTAHDFFYVTVVEYSCMVQDVRSLTNGQGL